MNSCGSVATEGMVIPTTSHRENCRGQESDKKKVVVAERLQESVKPSSLSNEDSINIKEVEVLSSAKAEMSEVREENKKLKMMLEQVDKDYHSLKLRFFDIIQQESTNKSPDDPVPSPDHKPEEPELVSLSLGRSPSLPKNNDKVPGNIGKSASKNEESKAAACNLTLSLDSKFEIMSTDKLEAALNPSQEDSLEDQEAGETWPPSKVARKNGDDELGAQQSHTKRARVCVRARCDTPTMNDGCQWRKYGQKIAKGNPCPRAYYRCTVAPACPVRKQVQRCVDDMSVLITTYEGTHNHPLPVSATAMASTTSAAASMLLSGSSSSSTQSGLNYYPNSNSLTQLNGLTFSHSNNSMTNQFYLPNPSSQLFPTITLDLTAPFNRLTSNPRFPSSGISFSSTQPNSNINYNTNVPTIWTNGHQNYSTTTQAQQKQGQQAYQINMDKNNQQILTETLTKAITSDPSLRNVIAAAISTMIGSNNGGATTSGAPSKQGVVDPNASNSLGHGLKLGEANNQNGSTCGSTYYNKVLPSNNTTSQKRSLLQQPALPFSIFNSSNMPATSNKEQES